MIKNNQNNYKITHLWTDQINKNIENKIISCFNKTFSHKYTNNYFDWKFRKNPFGKSLHIIGMNNKKIISSRAFWRLDINNLEAYQCVDTSVLPSYQQKGIFIKTSLLGSELLNNKLIYNSPNNYSGPTYLKCGWKKIDNSRCIKVNIRAIMTRYAHEINWNYKILKWRYEDNPVNEYFKLKEKNYYYLFRKIKNKFFLLVGKTKIRLNLKDIKPFICFSYDHDCKGILVKLRHPWVLKGRVNHNIKSYHFDLT
jgi:hypothetical protein